jgi:hypothetical protein
MIAPDVTIFVLKICDKLRMFALIWRKGEPEG